MAAAIVALLLTANSLRGLPAVEFGRDTVNPKSTIGEFL